MNFNKSTTAKDKQPQEESKQLSSRQVTLDSKYSDMSKLYLQKLFNRNKNGSLRSSKKDSPPKEKIAITPSISDLASTMFRQKKQLTSTPHEIVSLQAKSIHNQGQRFYCEEQNVTLMSKKSDNLKDDDILLCSKSNKRKKMNREMLNRPNTQEGTSFYFKKKNKNTRNLNNTRTQDNT